jgi:hypothetical protein
MNAKNRAQFAQTNAAQLKPKRWHIVLWILLGMISIGIVWTVTSDNPFAQGLQELAGFKHDQSVLEAEAPFTVAAHSFRFYKFTLPEGSSHVSIVGQFNVVAPIPAGKQNETDKGDAGIDNNIEVFVLSEPAFAVWQNGYATSSVYESGKVSQGTLQSELPADAGIFYLVVSNRSSPKTAKKVTASIVLRYKSWGSSGARTWRRFVDWLGL